MSLEDYRRKRDFARTHEPRGDALPEAAGSRFVIQKHQARALHYDLRLELDGVLKSWAVPKGPSLDPAQKRLAVRTEDHPLEYIDFEGAIPAGQYGAGTMLVWDTGVWQCASNDPSGDLERGELKFALDGHKLQGRWMLLWTGRRSTDKRKQNQWLLFKERDASTRPAEEYDVLDDLPLSVLSGRDLEEIAAGAEPKRPQARRRKNPKSSGKKSKPRDAATDPPRRQPAKASDVDQAGANETQRLEVKDTLGAKHVDFPRSFKPCLPTTTTQPPSDDRWSHEIKYDGYRMLCAIQPQRIRFLSRNGNDWTEKVSSLVSAVRRLPTRHAVLDGEVAVIGESGATDFQALQNAIHSRRAQPLKYYAFDLLYLDGYSLINATLQDRRKLLRQLIAGADFPETPTDGDTGWTRQAFPLLFSESILADGPLVLQQACQLGVEGIVSKRLDSRYVVGRSDSWLKAKCLQRREFIVGGFTDSTASRTGFGALVLGLPAEDGSLEYRGRVGTGFSETTLEELGRLLRERRTKTCPFQRSDLLLSKEKGTHWVEPNLLVEVEFGGWTGDGLLRFGSYRGVRDDLNLEDFRNESRNELGEVIPQETPPAKPPGERPEPDFEAASRLKLTHPERVVYAKPGITKLGIASYYAQVARFMIPHLAERPLSLVRCPRGPAQRCFFQKHPPKGLPAAVTRHSVQLAGEPEWLLEVASGEALLALVQLNVLEFHIWGARFDRLDRPDRVVLDLDPDESVAWPRVLQAAEQTRELLETAGLTSFVKTTGGKGLHVAAPLQRRHSWAEAKGLAECIALLLTVRWPARYTTSPTKAARRGKIYLDCNRNTRGATSVAPYSTRAREDAGVSTPLTWDELPGVASPLAFTLKNIQRRLDSLDEDPWAPMPQLKQSITQAGLQRLAEQ